MSHWCALILVFSLLQDVSVSAFVSVKSNGVLMAETLGVETQDSSVRQMRGAPSLLETVQEKGAHPVGLDDGPHSSMGSDGFTHELLSVGNDPSGATLAAMVFAVLLLSALALRCTMTTPYAIEKKANGKAALATAVQLGACPRSDTHGGTGACHIGDCDDGNDVEGVATIFAVEASQSDAAKQISSQQEGETRISVDGTAYTCEEFLEFFGADDGLFRWKMALRGPADAFECHASAVRIQARHRGNAARARRRREVEHMQLQAARMQREAERIARMARALELQEEVQQQQQEETRARRAAISQKFQARIEAKRQRKALSLTRAASESTMPNSGGA